MKMINNCNKCTHKIGKTPENVTKKKRIFCTMKTYTNNCSVTADNVMYTKSLTQDVSFYCALEVFSSERLP